MHKTSWTKSIPAALIVAAAIVAGALILRRPHDASQGRAGDGRSASPGFTEDFSGQQINDARWLQVGAPIVAQDGRAATDFTTGTGVLVTRKQFGNGVYRATFRCSGDGHTEPNLNFMRSDNTSTWGWRGYDLVPQIHDGGVCFRAVGVEGGKVWWSPNGKNYKPDVDYLAELTFTSREIRGRIARKKDGVLMDEFLLPDATFRQGYFALRGNAYSTSIATWDDISITESDQ